jgi:cytochrome c2
MPLIEYVRSGVQPALPSLNLSKPPFAFWFSWHCLAVAAIVLIPIRLEFDVIWNLDPDTRLLVACVAVAYLASVAGLTLITSNRRLVRVSDLRSTFGPVFAALFLFLAMYPPQRLYPRWVTLQSLMLAGIFILVPLILRGPLLAKAAGPVLVLAIAGSLLPSITRSAERNLQRKVIRTNAYSLIARYYGNRIEVQETGGGLSQFGSGYLLATGEGRLYALQWSATTEQLEIRPLPHRVPLNRADFLRDTADSPVIGRVFRAADILVHDAGDSFRLFASHHYWRSDTKCFTVRVSATAGTYSAFLDAAEPTAWTTLYESDPCLPFDLKASRFKGDQVGGALQQLDAGTLLLTVGDHDHDGVHLNDRISQQEDASYGKTILIDLETGAASTYTIGHRNPQGLYIDPSGNIWSSEHGPQGGDELNLLVKGKNYGWPIVTYGTNYGWSVWPLNPRQGRHDGFEPPVYAWVPSVGVSSLTGIRGNLFGRWKGDLLVASLVGTSLWRVRVERGRVISTEKIEIGSRVRDVMEGEDGRLILWTEKAHQGPTSGALVVIEPVVEPGARGTVMAGATEAQRGELLFARCVGCHAADGANRHGIGPHLDGIVGRRIASADGFSYSDALKGISGEWTAEKLDALLADPQKFAPGTSMQSEGVAEPEDRGALIQYLKTR